MYFSREGEITNMKYSELIPSVHWKCDPSSNTNILILCHPDQVNYYIPLFKNYIWSKFCNVTIWNTKYDIQNIRHLNDEIDTMDAVIVVVSELFISTEHIIGESVFPHILEKGIPVLPFLLGNNLAAEFDRKYGHIHFIKSPDDIHLKDLHKYIDSFITEENSKKSKIGSRFNFHYPKNPFTQTYFISYRKKDIKYISILQNKIQQDVKLLDTQLWYDTYLIPGKNYDHYLRRMINECNAMILVVTENLFEPNNYVLTKELPWARCCGKKIIAIEMEETDINQLKKIDIDIVYKLDEWDKFTSILEDAGLYVPVTNKYAKHLYQLGISYLEGNKVQYNFDLACSLLYQSAEIGCDLAYEALIEVMSGEYDCIYEDDTEAINLFNKYIDFQKTKYSGEKTNKNLEKIFEYLRKFGEFYFKKHDYENAYNLFHECYKCAELFNEDQIPPRSSYLSVSCLKLGETLSEMGKYDSAETFYRKSVNLDYESYNENDIFIDSGLLINLLTSLCELGNFYQERKLLLKAQILYEEVLKLIKNSGCFYGLPWEQEYAFNGYIDEYSAKSTQELLKYAIISLMEIRQEYSKNKIYHPIKKILQQIDSNSFSTIEDRQTKFLTHEIMLNTIKK